MLQRPVPSPSTGEGQDGGEARHPEPLMVSLSNHAGGPWPSLSSRRLLCGRAAQA